MLFAGVTSTVDDESDERTNWLIDERTHKFCA